MHYITISLYLFIIIITIWALCLAPIGSWLLALSMALGSQIQNNDNLIKTQIAFNANENESFNYNGEMNVFFSAPAVNRVTFDWNWENTESQRQNEKFLCFFLSSNRMRIVIGIRNTFLHSYYIFFLNGYAFDTRADRK